MCSQAEISPVRKLMIYVQLFRGLRPLSAAITGQWQCSSMVRHYQEL
jgi:hypothetical protein